MSYTITYRHAYNSTSERWGGTFTEAKNQAINSVTSGAIDGVEIRDSTDKLVFHYPAVMRRA